VLHPVRPSVHLCPFVSTSELNVRSSPASDYIEIGKP